MSRGSPDERCQFSSWEWDGPSTMGWWLGDFIKEGHEQWDIKPCISLLKVMGTGLWEPD